MYRKYWLVTALVGACSAPCVATAATIVPATTPIYFVSQDKTTFKCYVVAKIGKNGQVIGQTGYLTKSAALKALKAAPECNKP